MPAPSDPVASPSGDLGVGHSLSSGDSATGRSLSSATSSAPHDVETLPAAARRIISAIPLGAVPSLDLRPGALMGGDTSAGQVGLPGGTGAASLGVAEWTIGSSVVVSVTGEIDIATTHQLSEALSAALSRGPKGLICDLSGVNFLGAAGLTVLAAAQRRAIAGHAWFDIVCPQPLPRKAIAVAALDAMFCLHDRVDEAIDAQARHVDRPGLTTTSAPT